MRNMYIRNVISSNVGSPTKPNYKPVYGKTGVYELEEDGIVNVYDDIQSHLSSCDMGILIEKYKLTGDSSILNQRDGFYDDVTEYPENYAEMANMIINANIEFMNLPLNIREEYGQSPALFYSDVGSDKFNKLMGLVEENINIESEVIENEKSE